MSDSKRMPPEVTPGAERNPIEPAPGTTPIAPRRKSLWRSVWFAVKAIEIRLRFIAVLIGIGLLIGYWDTIKNHWDKWTRPATAGGATLSADHEFYCPMHPSVVRDKPDPGGAVPKCPICGMPLSKRKKGELPQLPSGVVSRVQLSPYRVQLAGIRTVAAERRPLAVEIETVGYVTIDERKLSRIVVRASGYVEKLYVNESFAEVSAGDPLAEIYSPQLYSSAQELLIARNGTNARLAETARERLRLLGVADEEIDEIIRTGKATPRLIIRSPHSGHVFEKRIVEGESVQAGQMLFEVADLSAVWIEGEVFEKDAAMLHAGQTVEASVEAFPGQVFEGRVGLVHPHIETATRTLRVRFELANPGHLLRPGMFATLRLKTPIQDVEPFRSQLVAQQARPLHTIAFAKDSASAAADGDEAAETPLQPEDAAAIAQQRICPVTGAKLGSMGKPVRADASGRVAFLCCAGCEDKFSARPDYYLARLTTITDKDVLAVPEQAVIDTGTQKIVYVERVPGLFDGVPVTLGPLADGYYAVIEGILPGDRVASAGAFLVDAETRLNPAAASAFFGASGGPSSGVPASPSATQSGEDEPSGPMAASDEPSDEVGENIARLPAADRALAQRQRLCPITQMPLGSMGVPYKMVVQGNPLFLCCEACKAKVDSDPQAVLKKVEQAKARRP